MGHQYIGDADTVCSECNNTGLFHCSRQNKHFCHDHHDAHWDDCVNAIRTAKFRETV